VVVGLDADLVSPNPIYAAGNVMIIFSRLVLPSLLCTAFLVLALGASLAIGGLGNAHSIFGLGFTAVGGLSGRDAVRIFMGYSTFAGIWVDGSSAPTIAANGLATRVLDAILAKQTRSKKHTRDHR
jgi:hypothetical protein